MLERHNRAPIREVVPRSRLVSIEPEVPVQGGAAAGRRTGMYLLYAAIQSFAIASCASLREIVPAQTNRCSRFSSLSLTRAFHGCVRYDSGQRFLMEFAPPISRLMR